MSSKNYVEIVLMQGNNAIDCWELALPASADDICKFVESNLPDEREDEDVINDIYYALGVELQDGMAGQSEIKLGNDLKVELQINKYSKLAKALIKNA